MAIVVRFIYAVCSLKCSCLIYGNTFKSAFSCIQNTNNITSLINSKERNIIKQNSTQVNYTVFDRINRYMAYNYILLE